jgi:transposase-like protein
MSKSIFSAAHFNDEAAAYAFVEARIWPDGRVCPHCGVLERSAPLKGKSNRPGLYKCYACRKPFTVKIGTIFEASHIAMRDWLVAIHLICSSKKGISANQLHRTMGITLKSAWFMAHRIREAMAPSDSTPPIGGEGKTVEADEMFIGNKVGKRKHPGSGGYAHKRAILALVERGGAVRSFTIDEPTRYEIRPIMDDNIHFATTKVYTDGSNVYRFMPAKQHESVDHSKGEYVRYTKTGKIHTNTVEGVFSIFRRGMTGTYQHCGEQHLNRYLAEFDFRYSNRASLGVSDEGRVDVALAGTAGKRLTYRTTVRA